MADNRAGYASEQEVSALRDEVRYLRAEQQRLRSAGGNGNGQHHEEEDGHKPQQQEKAGVDTKPHPYRKFIVLGLVLVGIVAAVIWWLHSRNFEGTDDAIVDGHISGIGARIAGTITGVYAEENQFVKAGQVVVDLDLHDYQAAVRQARSQFLQAQGQTQAEEPNIPVTEVSNQTSIATTGSEIRRAEAGVEAADRSYAAALAKVRESEANSAKAQADVERYRPLAEKDEVPREQFDQVVANAKALAATVAANQASAEAAQRQVEQSRVQVTEARQRADEARRNAPHQVAIQRANVQTRRASAEAARAQLDQALLNLSYCRIVTPISGVVAKRTAEVGQQVTPGQQVMLVTQAGDLWVTANFRETQLRRMQAGQSTRIHVDALGLDYDGYVESMPAASGSVTSLLPPENATGNFVKVVQRLPVRIRFRKGQQGLDRLRPGMSVEPKVRVR